MRIKVIEARSFMDVTFFGEGRIELLLSCNVFYFCLPPSKCLRLSQLSPSCLWSEVLNTLILKRYYVLCSSFGWVNEL